MPTTTNYIWDDENYLAESDVTNTINVVYTNEPRQYGNLVSTRISGATSYHHFDAMGSTRQLTNAAGHVSDTALYDAWGNVVNRTGQSGVPLLWVGAIGYYSDKETTSHYVRRRMYLPSIARWCSFDPVFSSGMLRYRYAMNCPIGQRDPSGLLSWQVDKGGNPRTEVCAVLRDGVGKCGVGRVYTFTFDGATISDTHDGFPINGENVAVQRVWAVNGYIDCWRDDGFRDVITWDEEYLEAWSAFSQRNSNTGEFDCRFDDHHQMSPGRFQKLIKTCCRDCCDFVADDWFFKVIYNYHMIAFHSDSWLTAGNIFKGAFSESNNDFALDLACGNDSIKSSACAKALGGFKGFVYPPGKKNAILDGWLGAAFPPTDVVVTTNLMATNTVSARHLKGEKKVTLKMQTQFYS
jgi:RHS repeat-associated protein